MTREEDRYCDGVHFGTCRDDTGVSVGTTTGRRLICVLQDRTNGQGRQKKNPRRRQPSGIPVTKSELHPIIRGKSEEIKMEDKSFRSLVLLQERIARRVREGTEYSTEKRHITG